MNIKKIFSDDSKFNSLYNRARKLGYSVCKTINPALFVICATPDAQPIPYKLPLQTLTLKQLETCLDHICFYNGLSTARRSEPY